MADEKILNSQIGRRAFVTGAVATGAMVALSGCGKKSDSGSAGTSEKSDAPAGEKGADGAVGGGSLKFYINNPASIDPFNAQETEGMQVVHALYDTLTAYDFQNEKLVPLACESYESNDSADTFTFHLKKGAKFHNGDPVTAKDFKFAWERICNPKTAEKPSVISYHLGAVKGYQDMLDGKAEALEGVQCPDDNTLVVSLSEPFADFPFVVTHPALSPVPSGGAASDFQAFFTAPVGNGPFMMDGQWVDGQYIKVKRFDDYYGEKPKVDGVDFMIFKDPKTAFTEFEAGNLDFANIPTGRIGATQEKFGVSEDGYTANPGKQCFNGAETSTYYLAMNCKDQKFSNKDFRIAVSYAVNRQAICDTIFEGSRIPADGVVPPGVAGYKEGLWEHSKYDVEKAKEYFEKAGYPADKLKDAGFTLVCNSGGGHEEIMQLVQADLGALGIPVDIQTQEWAAYLKELQAGNYQIGRLGWVADYPIMENFLYPLFYTDNGDNRSQYSNPEIDKKIIESRKITDDAKRIQSFQEIAKTVGEDMPVLPIMFYRHTHVASKRVNNLYFGPTHLAALDKCWLSE